MSSTWNEWLTQLFRLGALPDDMKAQLQAEGMLFAAEQIGVTVIYRNFIGLGKRYGYHRSGSIGSIAMSKDRVIGRTYLSTVLHVAYDGPLIDKIKFEVVDRKYLTASFDASDFHPKQTGRVELRFRLPEPRMALDVIESQRGRKTA